MKKAPAILAVIGSIPFFVLGLLFLIASASGANRILVAAALLAIATVLLVAGLRRLRRLAAIQPDALETGAVELARRLGGELTISQLRAEYGISAEEAGKVLEKLVHEGSCRREQREDRLVYVFAGLMTPLKEKVCPYCGTKLPVRSGLRKCPNCGAQLEITKT